MSAPRTLDEAREAVGAILRSGPMHVDGAVEHAAPLVLAMIDEARVEGVLRTMRLVTRVVELAPWGVGDPLAIRDDLLRALEPGAEVPS